MEDFNITGMVRSHGLAGRILDASWGRFLQLLFYKAERAGRMVVNVNPMGTSREGDSSLDRDYLASLDTLMQGRDGPMTPVERRPLLHITAKAVVVGQAFSMKQKGSYQNPGVVHP